MENEKTYTDGNRGPGKGAGGPWTLSKPAPRLCFHGNIALLGRSGSIVCGSETPSCHEWRPNQRDFTSLAGKARGESVPAENSVDSFFVKGPRPAGFSPNDFITPRDGCESNFNCFKFRDRLTPAFFFFFFFPLIDWNVRIKWMVRIRKRGGKRVEARRGDRARWKIVWSRLNIHRELRIFSRFNFISRWKLLTLTKKMSDMRKTFKNLRLNDMFFFLSFSLWEKEWFVRVCLIQRDDEVNLRAARISYFMTDNIWRVYVYFLSMKM